jgi:uncharacterized caspase-like protein
MKLNFDADPFELFLPWELARRGVCHGFDDEKQIGEGMWGEVYLTCVVGFPILNTPHEEPGYDTRLPWRPEPATQMKLFRWFSFLLLVAMQGIFSAPGGGAEPGRAAVIASAPERNARVAVVIGNSNYPYGALANPKNDATAMAASLRKLGFEVELKLDASKADMDGILRRFSGKVEKAGVAALFYAGHGVQVNGNNYLVPIDASPKNERDLKRDMVKMDDVIDDMGDARVKLVFFDACRDNPLSRSFSRGGSRGMAAPIEATGTLISFATKHGNTAADGDGKHSPYTAALLAALENPGGVEIEQMLRKVQQGVKQATAGQQEPWRYGSLDGDFYFKAADAPVDTAKVQQEAVDKAVLEAMRRANEQAAHEKAEFQQSIKAQQAASDRAVAEAIKSSKEQAARERTELQQSMEKMLKEALARQNAAIEAERAARQAAGSEPVKAQTSLRPANMTPASTQVQQPVQLATVASTVTAGSSRPGENVLAALSSAPGDEWEYLANDEMFGKKQKLVLRVKAVSSEGVLEEVIWNGKPVLEWAFGSRVAAIATPNEADFMLAPHWNGSEVSEVLVEGGQGRCVSPGRYCRITLKVSGHEKLTVAAGIFDAIRLDGWISMGNANGSDTGTVTIWYSQDQRRLLKQSALFNGRGTRFNETLELSAIRRAPR